MRLRPLFARIILERETLQTKTSILIPQDAERRNAPSRGRVLAVGPNADPDIKALVGSTVLFGQHAGTWINEDGTVASDGSYFVCNDEDLIAVVAESSTIREAA